MEDGAGFDPVAWWGAVVATVVAAVGLYDRLFRKPLPVLTYGLSGSHEEGNHIAIINASSVPMLVTHWRLYWAKPVGFGLVRQQIIEENDFEELEVVTVAPFDHMRRSFVGRNHFDWGYENAKLGQLYLEIHIIGRRRPVILHVYNPDPEVDREPRSLRRLLPHALRPSAILADDA